jgi:predicted phage terminase large subunit-like protein
VTNPADEFAEVLESASDLAHLASPLAIGQRIIQDFRPRAHQKLISDAIVDAQTGRGPRFVCVSVPPQYGKSTITSVAAPLWWIELHSLGIVKGGLVGIVSYEDDLAMSWSKLIRETIEQQPDQFFSQLRKDSRGAKFWATAQGGGVIAVGIAGTIVGRPISLLVIDDPTKNEEQAASDKHRETVWNFWQAVGVGRLQPWTIVIITMTRWKDDDLIGRIMSREFPGNPDKWRYIRVPAVADPTEGDPDPLGREIGEPLLRPQAEQTVEEAKLELQDVKESISQYHWHTIWLQKPTNPEGAILYADKWRYWGGDVPTDERYDLPADFEQIVMSWDMAFKDLKTSDWVVGGAWGRNEMDFYLLDLVRARMSFTDTCSRVNSFAKTIRYRYPKATTILIEDKANGPAVMDQIRSKVGGLVEFDPGDFGSKIARAQAIQPFLVGGNLYIPAPSEKPWVREYVKECGDFPNSAHDDQVDMTTQAILHMLKYKFAPSVMATPDSITIPDRAPARTFTAPIPFRR